MAIDIGHNATPFTYKAPHHKKAQKLTAVNFSCRKAGKKRKHERSSLIIVLVESVLHIDLPAYKDNGPFSGAPTAYARLVRML